MSTKVTTRAADGGTTARLSRPYPLTGLQLVVEVIKYALLLLLAITFILPFVWMFSSALKDDSQVYHIPPIWIPSPSYWNNFADAWMTQNFNLYLFNTIVKYALPSVIGTVLSSVFVAYSFARIRWVGRDFLFFLCLSTMMVPYQVTMVSLFVTFKHLGWLNTFKPLVIPAFFGNPYFIFMLRQFFLTIPHELSDAARIDGANEFDILWRIIMPLAKPALAVVILFQFMGTWNDYLGPLIYVNREGQWTIALAIERLRGSIYEVGNKRMAYPYLMAVSTIVTTPILVIFFLAQRTFIEGISLTGIKG